MEKEHKPARREVDRLNEIRTQGYAQEAAERMAGDKEERGASVRGATAPPYEDWPIKDLRREAEQLGIREAGDMPKDDLVQALREARKGEQPRKK